MSKVFKKFPNKILVHMKTFNKTYIRVLDHLLGVEKHLSVFFPNSLYYIFSKVCIASNEMSGVNQNSAQWSREGSKNEK